MNLRHLTIFKATFLKPALYGGILVLLIACQTNTGEKSSVDPIWSLEDA